MFLSIKKLTALLTALVMTLPLAQAESPAPSATPNPFAAPVADSAMDDDGSIRVLLKSLGSIDALHLTIDGEYAVENDPGFRFVRGAEISLHAIDGKIWLNAGGLVVDMGQSVTLTRHASDEETNGLLLAETNRSNLYNGDLSATVQNGALRLILTTDVEEYLYGVVAYEMSDSFPLEALKAQAVAARTYAMQRRYAAGSRDWDVTDTTADQVFKGFDPDYTRVITAVDATRGVVGMRNDAFAQCYYTASNGGRVATPKQIWGGDDDGAIRAKDDPYDLENPRSLVNSVEFARDMSDCAALREMIAARLDDGQELVEATAVTPVDAEPWGSRMYQNVRFDLTVRVEVAPTPSPQPSATPAATPVNWLLTLFNAPTATPEPAPVYEEIPASVTLSTYGDLKDGLSLGLNGGDYELITAVETETGFALEMRRFGHGVGMSQRGAQQMAGEHDFTWREILSFYYPGMTLERIDWQTEPLTDLGSVSAVMGYARPDPTPKPTPAPLPALESGERYGTVTLSNADSTLNVRETPSTAARVLDQFESGRRVIVCTEPDEDGWIRIRTAELTGYVKAEYVATEP